LEFRNELG